VLEAAGAAQWSPVDGGTLVVIEGPRFSTRAESRWFAASGWSVVGMTGYPEAVLARELELCYTAVCLVTDLDAGLEEGDGVTHAQVLEVFAKNVDRMRSLVLDVVPRLPVERTCVCAHALEGMSVPLELP
jgi:5'-methylthioadenosine phosphorylase